ncbi:U-scoloptoxin(01)-Er1a like protein [Argiope bruennichi]|uniref:U-scoloptoxin(01)-Er1a like protein n=1 Tax=Argiope bruennichi TaxID=94029 RepID=A0A8T0EUQ0_ARGBR|nr:U-scoloptoxin(01)-Er1a like protein [Argiope bruennichi]
MGLLKVSVGLFSLACLICLTNGSAIKTTNQKIDDTLQSASKTFGVKTITRQTTHSNNGVVTRVFKQTQITTGNTDAFPESAGNQAQLSNTENTQGDNQHHNFQHFPDTVAVDHSSGQNDFVHGLLPLDEAKPVQFGTRLGSNTKKSDCSIKGDCLTQVTTSGGNKFDKINTETHQEQLPQEIDHQEQEQSTKSNFEPEDVAITKTQEQVVDQGEQQLPEKAFGTDFDGQYEETLRNLGQGGQFIEDEIFPGIDTQFPEQGDSETNFDVGNLVPFVKEEDFIEKQQENQEQSETPLDFGYVEQQNQGDSQDVSGVYITSAVNQGNVNFQEQSQAIEDQARNFESNQGNFQQQSGSTVIDHNNNFAFQQDTGFQEPFVPHSQVSNEFQQQFVPQSQVSNENSYSFQDNSQDFFLTDPIEALRYNVPGNPGEDYPIFYKVPETSFQCSQQPFAAGIYGDMDAQCQVFHFCTESGGQNSFLCPNGTVFNQQYFVCDWWYNYNCSDTPSFYNLNAQLYWDFDNFEPTQIITGTGVGSSEEQHFSNTGEFQGQTNSHQFSGSIPEQVQFQTRVTHSGQSQVDTTSTNQQIHSSVQQHGVDSYGIKRQDTNNIQSNVRTSFTQQSNLAQNTNLDQQIIDTSEHDLNTQLGQTQISDSHLNNKPTSSASVSETHSGTSSQQEVSSILQNHNVNKEEGNSFDHSQATKTQQNVNSEDFTVQEKKSQLDVSVPSISSDTRRGWKPDSDSGTRYPDQSGFEQQHVDDQHQFQTNDQSVSNVASQQTNSAEVSSAHEINHHNQVTQDFVPTESSDGFNGENRNIVTQSEIQQQHVQFPLEVSARSDQDSNIDSHEQSEISQKGAFTTQSPKDIGKQQNNIDAVQDISFKRQAVFTSFNQENANQDQSSFHDSGSVTDQPNLLDVLLPETFEEVDQDSQSARDGDVEQVSQEEQIDGPVRAADAFDGQQMIDAIQDAVNYDDIINGFHSRNVAFMNIATTPEPFNSNQRVYENRPAQVHAISFQRNSNQNVNINTELQTPSPNFQQENINVGDVYTIMRGSAHKFQEQNGQQRLSFRPYGINFNTQEKKEIQNLVNHNEGNQQNVNQGVREQVIFPVDQKQENGQNEWWRKTQDAENNQSVKLSNQDGGRTETKNQNINAHISQSHLNADVSSNENLNVPTDDQLGQSHNSLNANQQHNDGLKQQIVNQNNQDSFQSNEQQRPYQNIKTAQRNHFQTEHSRFQNDINQPQFQNQNAQPDIDNFRNQQIIQSQHQFQAVNDQSHFNGNNQPESQNLNNQQNFQDIKSQVQLQDHSNRQGFGNDNSQQYSGDQRQFQNVNNQQEFQDVNSQQQFQEQIQFHNNNNQQRFQGEPQFQNVNNPEQFQNVNIQQQFQEQHEFQNVNNQQPLQEQHQQQHFANENSNFEDPNINNQPRFPDTNIENAPGQHFEQNAGVRDFSSQEHSQAQDSAEFNSRRPAGGNTPQSHGIKGYHSQQHFREARNGYNFPKPNLQVINANDAVIYSQNDPRSSESAISYNGWKPIVRY